MTAEELKAHVQKIEDARSLLERFKAMEEADVLFMRPNSSKRIHWLMPATDDSKFDLLPHIRIGIRALSQAVEAEIAELERAVMWSKDAMRNPVEGRYAGLIRENFVPFPKLDVGVDLGQGEDSTAEIQWTTQNLTEIPGLPKPTAPRPGDSVEAMDDLTGQWGKAAYRRYDPKLARHIVQSGYDSHYVPVRVVKITQRADSEMTAQAQSLQRFHDCEEPQERILAEENGERIVVRREPIPTPPECSSDSGPLLDTESGK